MRRPSPDYPLWFLVTIVMVTVLGFRWNRPDHFWNKCGRLLGGAYTESTAYLAEQVLLDGIVVWLAATVIGLGVQTLPNTFGSRLLRACEQADDYDDAPSSS